MKTREQLIEEYSQLGNAAIPIAIYDVGERLTRAIASAAYDLTFKINTQLESAVSTFKYSSQSFQSVCGKLTDSYDGVFFHVRNFFRKN